MNVIPEMPERTKDTKSCDETMKRIGFYGRINVWDGGEIWNACLDEVKPVIAYKECFEQAIKNAAKVAHLFNSGSGMLAWIESEAEQLQETIKKEKQ